MVQEARHYQGSKRSHSAPPKAVSFTTPLWKIARIIAVTLHSTEIFAEQLS